MALDLECLWMAFRILPKLRKNQLLFVNIEPLTLGRIFGKGREGELLLKKFSRYARRVVFEITQGMKTADFPFIKKAVAYLTKKGFRIAIDDVSGIGSRLLLLASLKPHFLKIDISLVRGIRENHLHQDIVQHAILLGKKVSASIVAEGVEKREDVEYIRQIGIPYAQGFYFSHPKRQLLRSGFSPFS